MFSISKSKDGLILVKPCRCIKINYNQSLLYNHGDVIKLNLKSFQVKKLFRVTIYELNVKLIPYITIIYSYSKVWIHDGYMEQYI